MDLINYHLLQIYVFKVLPVESLMKALS